MLVLVEMIMLNATPLDAHVMRCADFEKADDVFHLLSATDKALDRLDMPLHDWDFLRPDLRIPRWMRYLYRRVVLGDSQLRQFLA